MTEVTEEARAELDAINDVLAFEFGSNLAGDYANAIMLALDKHHGRTPPDPVTQWLHKSGWEGNAVAGRILPMRRGMGGFGFAITGSSRPKVRT